MFKSRKGFTLVELLVVIAIMAVLLTLITPALQKAREKARLVICSSNQHMLAFGLLEYAADNEGKFPPKITRPGYQYANVINYRPGEAGVDNNGGAMYIYLAEHFPSVEVFMCPLSPAVNSIDEYQSDYEEYDTIMSQGKIETLVSYNMYWGGFIYNNSPEPFMGPKTIAGGRYKGVRTSRLLLCDTMTFWGLVPNTWWLAHPTKNSSDEGQFYSLNDALWWRIALFNDVPENLPLNAGFVDGSVSRYFSDEAYNVAPDRTNHIFYIPPDWK